MPLWIGDDSSLTLGNCLFARKIRWIVISILKYLVDYITNVRKWNVAFDKCANFCLLRCLCQRWHVPVLRWKELYLFCQNICRLTSGTKLEGKMKFVQPWYFIFGVGLETQLRCFLMHFYFSVILRVGRFCHQCIGLKARWWRSVVFSNNPHYTDA